VYNFCTKYLARTNNAPRHDFGQFPQNDPRAAYSEPWRFPIIDSYRDPSNPEAGLDFNRVTFVYYNPQEPLPLQVAVIGTFANLFEPIPLERVEESPYFAVTVVVPKNQVHTYQFLVNGRAVLDPINTQQIRKPDGEVWSRFFTHACALPITFERWERTLLERLVTHILPFNTKEGENFMRRYVDFLDRQTRDNQMRGTYRLDASIGVVNFIDKLLAKEENHYLDDYRTCLAQIQRILTQRIPTMDPEFMPESAFVQLYDELATGSVQGWDYSRYGDPAYFLRLLRRHTFTGAFSHPKYHGNAGGAGWAYLREMFTNAGSGESIFNWRVNCEKPYGISEDYNG
jgi:hypothetical protein